MPRIITFCIILLFAAAAFTYLRGSGILEEYPHVAAYAVGIFVAVLTFIAGEAYKIRQSRKQHTIKVLFETRLSTEYRKFMEKREVAFPPGHRVTKQEYLDGCMGEPPEHMDADTHQKLRTSRKAAVSMLNYYEFLALGIERRDFDKNMLKGTIRGIMCNLVRDMAEIVEYEQGKNPKAYEHLTALYNDWKSHDYPRVGSQRYRGPFDDLRQTLAEWISPN